ncbi:putative Dynamin-1-like protein [Hypsibius exemplaris]|uniref:Dynamin-1-like protein n=1 Tax=Hypsibius exemplaris TaxID=2072580 RepID=A0A9X6NHD2_HYPEX|nr:putative Dynamin-1-like protein [Hypsibius exemplaris]
MVKSSVLESIAGHSFLPRGQNTVTRTPIKVVMRSKDQVQQITGTHLELYHFLPSSRKIQKNLAEKGISVSYRIILRVIKSEKEEDIPSKTEVKNVNNGDYLLSAPNVTFYPLRRPHKKIAKSMDAPNPPTQREISCKLGISTGTVSRVLKKDLGLTYHKKVTTHVLTPKPAQQRLDRGPHFLRCLSRRKLPVIVSINETYLDLNEFTGERDGCYESPDKPAPKKWKKKPPSGWPEKVMVCMGISWNGPTSLYFVSPKAKMNSQIFIDLILESLFKKDVPRLYPGEEKKVILQMDSAGAHRVREDQIIYSEIEALIEKYLENPQAIILVVHQAGNDIETSRGLSAANKVDPHGLRTICVLTKLDLVGKEDDITDRLAGKSNHDDSRIKCRRVIGVVNTPLPRTDGIMQDRAQLLAAQVAAENAFFQQRKYTALAGNHGTKNLVSYLSTVFVEHLKGSLPQLRIDLDNLKVKLEDHIHRLGPVNFKQYTYTHNPFSNGEFEYVISVIDRFCHTLIESINGRIYLGSRQVRGGALLEQRFNTLYRNSLDNIDPLGDMSTAETWSKIKMAGGLTAQMFLNETAFELLTKKEIARMKSESINCAVGAHTEVLRICQEAAKESIKDVRITYPALYQAILDEVNDFLSEKLKKTKKMVIHGVEMHWDYINVKNRHFALKKDEVIGDRLLTATHQTDIVDQEPQSRILTSTGPLQLDMARMSEEEEKECMMYASLVRNYFDITRDTICDTVPKIVVRFMVKEVERQIRRHLTGRLGVEQIYSKLLVLSESVALRRREAGAKLKQYEQAVQMARELAIS